MALLEGFFRHKGPGLDVSDHRLLLGSIFRHLHRRIVKRWPESRPVTDLALMVATSQRLYAARSGRGALFVFRAEEAAALFGDGGGEDLLGAPSGGGVETAEAPLQAGDVVVLCNPALARVIGPRDVSVILGRARDPGKASLFLSAIAERKGAEGVLAALVWEVPNYQGAALLTGEAPPPGEGEREEEVGGMAPGPGEETPEEDHAEKAKKQWLSKWRRHREEP
jgi:hypothetical protein